MLCARLKVALLSVSVQTTNQMEIHWLNALLTKVSYISSPSVVIALSFAPQKANAMQILTVPQVRPVLKANALTLVVLGQLVEKMLYALL